MKKALLILSITTLLSTLLKGQVFSTAGVGIAINTASPVVELSAGAKIPFSDCAPRPFTEGLMVQAGWLGITDEGTTVFNAKIGKSFWLTDYSELQVLTGYAYHKEAEDKNYNNGTIVTVNYVHAFSYKFSWIVSGTGSKNFFAATIGLRYLFVR